MHVNVEDLSSVKKKLLIEVPEDVVSREVDNAYNELKKTAKIKGFRPGKVPRQVLVRRFQKDVHADVKAKIIQESFTEALQETRFNMVGDPDIDMPELEYQQPYKYEATLEISPELPDIDLSDIKLKRNAYQVTDEEMDAQLKMLQKNLTRHEPVKEARPAQDGDFLLIDYEGLKDGKPYAETQKTENYTLKIGAAQIAPEMDSALVGMQAGETREVTVTFPADHKNAGLAGRTIVFIVDLKEIREEVVPEIDDAFAQNFGSHQNLTELKQAITDNLQHGYNQRIRQELNEQAFQALLERVEFEVPEALIESELDAIVAETERYLMYHNVPVENIEKTREQMREKHRETAIKQVKRNLILGKVIAQEKLELTDEEYEAGLAEMAASFNQPVSDIKGYYASPENKTQLAYFRYTLLEKKAAQLIIDGSEIEDVTPELLEKTDAAEGSGSD